MGNIEDLLSSIKAEQTASPLKAESSPVIPKVEPEDPKPSGSGETRSVEELLGQLEGHPPSNLAHSSPTPPSAALNALLADLPAKRDLSQPDLPEAAPPKTLDQILAQPVQAFPKSLDHSNFPPSDRLPSVKSSEPFKSSEPAGLTSSPLPILEDLKTQYVEEQRQREAQERAEQERLRQEQEAALAQQRQEQERQAQEKQARLEKAAQAWLSQLEPLSGEAIWFDEFASHYPSRLAAAIDYLNLDD
jgi:hypothetical protein